MGTLYDILTTIWTSYFKAKNRSLTNCVIVVHCCAISSTCVSLKVGFMVLIHSGIWVVPSRNVHMRDVPYTEMGETHNCDHQEIRCGELAFMVLQQQHLISWMKYFSRNLYQLSCLYLFLTCITDAVMNAIRISDTVIRRVRIYTVAVCN